MEDALVITAPRIRQIVTYPLLIERLRGAYSEFSSFTIPPTSRHAIATSGSPQQGQSPSPSLLLMPAWGASSKCPYLLVKSVTVFPENGSKGLPAVAGTYVLSSLETGKQLAVMDGTELILWRTACTSALAADYLARMDAKVMLMVGAGALAPHLIKAHLAIRPNVETILIYNRTHANAVKLVQHLKASPLFSGRRVEAVTDLEVAVRASDLISCATLSCEPLVLGAWLSPGTHLDLVGSFTPSMRECDDKCVQRCRIVVDSAHAIDSSGDLVQPLEGKAIAREQIAGTLAELVQGSVMKRASEDEITMYKSVGCTVGDLAAAQIVYEEAIAS
ncbi:hypothetical protein M758_9G176300 [Ceratodon purpureus]|nr:hypothetical protein M758_9G176300 [Ceratodon purpureus]